jgi:replicative DNA helicase
VSSAYSLDDSVDELLDKAETAIFEISEQRLKRGFESVESLVQKAVSDIEQVQMSQGATAGIATGYPQLDELTLGLHPGELIVVAGRPSMGKTALALNMAENIAIQSKKGVGVFSIEMSQDQLVLRMLCSRGRVDQHKVRSGKLTDGDWLKLTGAADALSKAPIFIDDSPTLSALEMRAKARRLKSNSDIGVLMVDYIQLMHGIGRVENRQQEISSISRSIKALAKELEVPIIAISQLSRQVEQRGGSRIPQLSDLRESGAIEQDADLVLFVHRPEYYLSQEEKMMEQSKTPEESVLGKAKLIIAKQRNGPTGEVELAFIGQHTRFENLSMRRPDLPPGVEPVAGGGDSAF